MQQLGSLTARDLAAGAFEAHFALVFEFFELLDVGGGLQAAVLLDALGGLGVEFLH